MLLISIVIPVKNDGKTIINCLEAIKYQTLFGQTEVIIIDDGSVEIIATFMGHRFFNSPHSSI